MQQLMRRVGRTEKEFVEALRAARSMRARVRRRQRLRPIAPDRHHESERESV